MKNRSKIDEWHRSSHVADKPYIKDPVIAADWHKKTENQSSCFVRGMNDVVTINFNSNKFWLEKWSQTDIPNVLKLAWLTWIINVARWVWRLRRINHWNQIFELWSECILPTNRLQSINGTTKDGGIISDILCLFSQRILQTLLKKRLTLPCNGTATIIR